MEQFSHDLTLALEETSRCGARVGRWGMRRRTCSTGNLPCAPQPTEDSSSSPADAPTNQQTGTPGDALNNSILSDSDDRHELKLSLKSRHNLIVGNFESDSLNENFSPARPNTRRKRKFKRMAVEYETTPSTPGIATASPVFPGAVKKRVLKHTCQENFRANLFFCGKRKRSHRDRYMDYDHKQHSSSVPRQRDIFAPKNSSYMEYRNRGRNIGKPCEKIQPLNKSIISKIEKISQDSKNNKLDFQFLTLQDKESSSSKIDIVKDISTLKVPQVFQPITEQQNQRLTQKSGSLESSFNFQEYGNYSGRTDEKIKEPTSRKHKHSKRHEMKMQLQFDDPNFMDCGLNEFLSSSSLSSSDSEAAETNESDREGDDELTDWPGNEAMINFASKNDFKRARPPKSSKPTLSQIKSDEVGQDDDTLMSGDDINLESTTPSAAHPLSGLIQTTVLTNQTSNQLPPNSLNLSLKYSPASTVALAFVNHSKSIVSMPINIAGTAPIQQIESEMSGETSNHFLSSPNASEVREIRAGCRRIREERPGFSIITSVNEDLSKFLQDGKQMQLRLPDSDALEHEKLSHLAKLYSLNMRLDDGCAVLTKTSNTTQTVRVDQSNISKRFLSDYKRRCYGSGSEDIDLNEMAS